MKQHLVLLQDTSNIAETVSSFLLAYKGDLMQHLHYNETTLYNAYKRIHLIADFPKLNAQVCDDINAQSHTTNSQLLQQPATQEEVVEVMNKDPVDNTTPPQPHDFAAFVFSATNTTNTPNP
eukprot:6470840-Ditylum_brightwellii.AAC.1